MRSKPVFELNNHYDLHKLKLQEAEREALHHRQQREAQAGGRKQNETLAQLGRTLVAVGTQLAELAP